jgi:hypothetical protein
MSILKSYTTPRGITLGFHRVRQVVIDSNGVNALVHSFPSKDQFNGEADIPTQSWQTPLPVSVLGANSVADAEAWLVSDATSPLVSGTIDGDVDELTRARDAKRRALAAQRDTLEFAGVNVPDIGLVGTDPASQRLLTGAAVLAMISASQAQPFSLGWTLKDGVTVVTLDTTGVISTSVAIGVYVSAVYVAHRAALAALDAASTIEEVNAVQISLS